MGLASFRLPWADFLFPKNEIAIIANRFLIKKKSLRHPFPTLLVAHRCADGGFNSL